MAETSDKASDKASISIVRAENGQFKLDVAQGNVAHVEVVDVDFVLFMKDGTRVVLPNAAMDAMGSHPPVIQFTDTQMPMSGLMSEVGKINITDNPQPALSSLPPSQEFTADKMRKNALNGADQQASEQQEPSQQVGKNGSEGLAPTKAGPIDVVQQFVQKGIASTSGHDTGTSLPPPPPSPPPPSTELPSLPATPSSGPGISAATIAANAAILIAQANAAATTANTNAATSATAATAAIAAANAVAAQAQAAVAANAANATAAVAAANTAAAQAQAAAATAQAQATAASTASAQAQAQAAADTTAAANALAAAIAANAATLIAQAQAQTAQAALAQAAADNAAATAANAQAAANALVAAAAAPITYSILTVDIYNVVQQEIGQGAGGNEIYGGGGDSTTAGISNISNPGAAMKAETLQGTAGNDVIYSNYHTQPLGHGADLSSNYFAKLFHFQIVSNITSFNALTITNVQPGWSIEGATDQGGGIWVLDLTAHPVTANAFDIKLIYQGYEADTLNHVHVAPVNVMFTVDGTVPPGSTAPSSVSHHLLLDRKSVV